jgi:fructan beta-fructosidase
LESLEEPLQLDPSSNVYKLDLNIDLANTNGFDLDILKTDTHSLRLNFDKSSGIFSVDRTKSGLVVFNPNFASIEKAILGKNLENIKVEVYVDQSVVEIYLQDGAVVLTELAFPKESKTTIALTKN